MKMTIEITPELRFRLAYAQTLDIEVPDTAVPDGWQMVPVEPTPEMRRAAMNLHNDTMIYQAMLSAALTPEPTKGRTITEGQEFELTTVLQAIASGFSDDPAHDAVALLKRITGEVPWTGDSFQLPPSQEGDKPESAT